MRILAGAQEVTHATQGQDLAGSAVVAAALGIGAGVAVCRERRRQRRPITGDALEQATAAALAHTGGGQVTETEVDDEESNYEVEVTLETARRSTSSSIRTSTSSATDRGGRRRRQDDSDD